MDGKNKTLLYWVAGAVVLAGVLWLMTNPTIAPETISSPSPSGGVVGVTATPVGGTAMPKTYADALARYGSSRIQFDMYCQAIPKSSVYKQGATIMIDNRSGDARTVKVGATSYALAGYGWKIITLSSKTLPATLSINCGSGVNVGTIILQK